VLRKTGIGAKRKWSKLSGIERKIAGILKAIEDGMYTPSMRERMAALGD
jgi:hypothetical protein